MLCEIGRESQTALFQGRTSVRAIITDILKVQPWRLNRYLSWHSLMEAMSSSGLLENDNYDEYVNKIDGKAEK